MDAYRSFSDTAEKKRIGSLTQCQHNLLAYLRYSWSCQCRYASANIAASNVRPSINTGYTPARKTSTLLLTLRAQYTQQGLCNGRASVCLSYVDGQLQRWPAGLLLSALWAGDIDRQLPGPRTSCRRRAANAGSVMLTAEGRG